MKKALVVGPAWVGDMVMAQALFKRLQQIYQNGLQIEVLAPAWTQAIVAAMPEVHRAIHLPFQHGDLALAKRWAVGRALRAEGYTQAYILPNSWKSALIPFAAKIPRRIAWRGECRFGLLNDCRKLDKMAFPLMVQRFVALAEDKPPKAGLPLDQIPKPHLRLTRAEVESTLRKFLPIQVYTPKPLISLCPGAEFGIAKQWPSAYFATLAKYFIRQGYRILILGSAKDNTVGEDILRALQQSSDGPQNAILLTGKTTLTEAMHLLSASQGVVSNDSGLLHVAAALQRPVEAIYGPTDPGFTPPLSDLACIVETDWPCRPCFQRSCPLKHHQCMQSIYPQGVIEALESQLPRLSQTVSMAYPELVS